MIHNEDEFYYIRNEKLTFENGGLISLEYPIRLWRIKGSGTVHIYEDETKERLIYSGPLPYSFNPLIVLDGFFMEEDGTIELVCERGKNKDILTPYLNTTEGMSVISSGYNDDGTFTLAGLSSFIFNGLVTNNVYQSSNNYLGFGTSSGQLFIMNRDGCSTSIYRQEIKVDDIDILKIRTEGYTVYNNRVDSNRIIYELFIMSNNDMFLNLIRTPTSSNTGTSKLVAGSKTYELNLADTTGQGLGKQVSFYHLDEEGKTWQIEYVTYLCKSQNETKEYHLMGEDNSFYTYEEDNITLLDIYDLDAATFYEYGRQELPLSAALLKLINPKVYKWQKSGIVKDFHADMKAEPYEQLITCHIDASHETIVGIKNITAQYSGTIPIDYSLDEGASFISTTLQEFLNILPAELYDSLPESKKMTMIFHLTGENTITSFKITYLN